MNQWERQRELWEHQAIMAARNAREEAAKEWQRLCGCLAIIIVIGVLVFLAYVPFNGDLEIHINNNEERAYVYATKYTWWGLGPTKHYELKSIRNKWHIRERGTTKWIEIDFYGSPMDIVADMPEPPYPR